MRRRFWRRVTGVTLSFCVFMTQVPATGVAVYAGTYQRQGDTFRTTPSNALPKATPGNALLDQTPEELEDWELESPQGHETLELDGDWIHFKSGSGNDNGSNAARMVNRTFTDLQDGAVSFTLKPAAAPASTRFGVFVRYQNLQNAIFVGYDTDGWFWQIYDGNTNPYYRGTRVPGPSAGSTVDVTVTFEQSIMNVTVDGTEIFSDVDISGVSAAGKIAFKTGTYSGIDSDVRLQDIIIEEAASYTISGLIRDESNTPLSGVSVAVGNLRCTSGEDGTFQLSLGDGTHQLVAVKSGYSTQRTSVTVNGSDVQDIVLTMPTAEAGAVEVIESADMQVTVAQNFPRVISYQYHGKTFTGQDEVLDKLRINNKDVVPAVTHTVSEDGTSVVYVMTAVDAANGIDAVITAELKVVDNTLEFNITDIEDNKIVKTIEIPNHNLVTVKSVQEGAQLAGSVMSTNAHKSGDTIVDINESFSASSFQKKGYMYAFLSNSDLSAGLWSNSENNVAGGDWQRVTQTAAVKDGYTEVALLSTPWTYQKGGEYRKENGSIELDDGTVLEVSELPSAKVVITDDVNEDQKVDWQDGAIQYRKIMNIPTGSEKVPDLVAYRISMNFGSQAQNPFLMTLDGVKKVSLHTDGLGQSILLKGYGSEGHDSGHLNYADIGTRIGGAEDMKVLLEKGKEYGANFGIHVNASETYPESKYFSEQLMKKNDNGTYSYGWNWIDQGININADYDLTHGRAQRFKDLYDELGGEDNDLDFIYVDVWGNGQSGDNGTWASRQLAKEINGLGWRLGGEWGYAFENDSTFQHWAADLTYGGYSLKGINSQITRFIRNHEKDSWVGNYPSYGGAAVAPLLGGYNMKDFEGWQGRSDYNAYISNLFEVDLASKFVQHYQVSNIEYGNPVTMTDNGETYSWTPEMRVGLRDEENSHSLEIERMSNNYSGEKNAYMSRTMTFDGNKILEGREGDSRYLIPWFWDANGNELSEDDTKLYHWNTKGGETTWELPDGWTDCSSVYVYELTELGKLEAVEVQVDGTALTLNAEEQTPYVIYKGEKENQEMVWSEGMHIVDSGFNGGSLDAWNISGETESAKITKSQGSNDMLEISGNTAKVSLSQTLTDLEPNTKYIAMAGVDNRSEKSVTMEINNGDSTSMNQASRSIAKNFVQAYAHNTNKSTATVDNTSYFQNMWVFFETGDDTSQVTLTIKREGDEAATYLDDIRIVKNDSENFLSDTLFVQDFENVAQGIWPFVIGNAEGVTDNRTHLSEKHVPFTQSGWNGKVVSDVIQGNWALKTNGLTQREGLIYQTIPQNFMFQPGVDYVVSFDYEAGSDGTYALVSGDRPITETGAAVVEAMPNTVDGGRAQRYSFTLTGAENGQSWFGIYSTDTAADTRGVTDGGQINFNGYKDFVLDNLSIRVASSQKDRLREVIARADRLIPDQNNYTENTWTDFAYALRIAKDVNNNVDADQELVERTAVSLERAMEALKRTGISVTGQVTDEDGSQLAGIQVVLVTADGKQFTTYTDRNGTYSIAGAFYGENVVSIDDNGHRFVQKALTTTAQNQEMQADFVLTAAMTEVYGTVAVAGQKMDGARVALTLDGQEVTTVTTDAGGAYRFSNIPVKAYEIAVTKEGYDALSVQAKTSKQQTTRKDIMIQPSTSGYDYISNFSNGTTSLKVLPGNSNSDAAFTVVQNAQGTYETKIAFSGGSHNNVYDSAAPVFKNGEVEADVTALVNAPRFGILLRASDMNNRVYVGTGDTTDKWFAEHWGMYGNNWTGMYSGPTLNANTTVHMKVRMVDNRIQLWVNDTEIFDLTMDNIPREAGFVGFNARGSKSVQVSNIKVTSYDPPQEGVQNVVGRVVDQTGNPGADITVMLRSSQSRTAASYQAETNQNGEYRFKNIPLGSYQLSINNEPDKQIPVHVEPVPYYVLADQMVLGAETTVLKSALYSAISKAGELNALEYTKGSWEVFMDAYEAASLSAENDQVTQAQVDAARDNLLAAMNALRTVADKKLLNLTINAAQALSEERYTAESFSVIKSALEVAIACSMDTEATQSAVDDSLNRLNAAIKQLVSKDSIPVEDAALRLQVQIAEQLMTILDETKYTDASWQELQAALDHAIAVLAAESGQEAVDTALERLQAAISGLQLNPTPPAGGGSDDAALRQQIQVVEQMMATLDKTKYTDASWQELQAALNHAAAVLAADSEQAAVDAALTRLQAAVFGLQLRPTYPSTGGGSGSSGSSSSSRILAKSGDWRQDAKGWWYRYTDGSYPKQEWKQINGKWYYFNPEGYMEEGWKLINGLWYYLQPVSGEMKTGWIFTNGKWYYLNTDGSMFVNTSTPDGYTVGPDGAWIQ